MDKRYKVVIIGFAHMHINDVAAGFYENPRIDLVACADTHPLVEEISFGPYTRTWNLKFAKEHFGNPRVYEDYVEMLDTEKPDLAIITSENFYHAEIVKACAARGVGVCIEKPMAISYADAKIIEEVTREAGVFAIVNWPITWRPYLHQMKRLADEGQIGRVIGLQYRAGHTGPLGPGAKHRGVTETADDMTPEAKGRTWWHQAKCGGGAMLDLCCYGCLFSQWFIGGRAKEVTAMKSNLTSPWGDVEDNATLIARFDGAICNIEGTWTTPQPLAQAGPIVYGEYGSLTCRKTPEGVVVRYTSPYGEEEEFPIEPFADGMHDVAEAFVNSMDTGIPPHETLTLPMNLAAMEILDAGIRSAESGKVEAL
ncbi:MAG: Gfo/Idh/MocA family oxidoreductase [Clostridia bacterium]|nr:Gfo/Idh/MocA family oxidoreductase [Clostridia bacterium]